MGRSRIKEDIEDFDENLEMQEYQFLKEKNKKRRDNKAKDKEKWKKKRERQLFEDENSF